MYFFIHTMEVNGIQQLFGNPYSSKFILVCSTEERNTYRFGTTWGRVHFGL